MGAEGAKLETVLGYLLPARSRYLVQRAPTLSTFEKPPAKAVFSFLAHRVALIRLIDQRFLVRTTAKKNTHIFNTIPTG